MTHLTNPTIGQTVRFRRHEVGGEPPKGFEVGRETKVTKVDGTLFVGIEADIPDTTNWSVEWFEAVPATTSHEIPVGTRVRVTEALFILDDHLPFEGVIVDQDGTTLGTEAHPYTVQPVEGSAVLSSNGNGNVYAKTVEVIVEEEEPAARPTVDFSGNSRATAREYAHTLDSRVLTSANRHILKRAAAGDKVDAYDLNAAVTEALSSCATRAGQSMARRELTKKGRYLGHIVQAVLESHADSLPAYAPGDRSRAVESANAIAREQAAKIDEQARLLDEVRETLADAKREVDGLLSIAEARDAIITDLTAEKVYTDQKLSVVTAERDAAAAVISYFTERLEEADQQRVFGYWDGVKDATLPSSEG